MPYPSLELTPIEGSEDSVGIPDTDGDRLGLNETLGTSEGDDEDASVGAVEGALVVVGVIVRVGLFDVEGYDVATSFEVRIEIIGRSMSENSDILI